MDQQTATRESEPMDTIDRRFRRRFPRCPRPLDDYQVCMTAAPTVDADAL